MTPRPLQINSPTTQLITTFLATRFKILTFKLYNKLWLHIYFREPNVCNLSISVIHVFLSNNIPTCTTIILNVFLLISKITFIKNISIWPIDYEFKLWKQFVLRYIECLHHTSWSTNFSWTLHEYRIFSTPNYPFLNH